MSETPRISYVVEGPTDFIVLDAIVQRFLGDQDYVPNQIQPPISAYADDAGPLGGGWKGVLKWCEQEGTLLAGANASLTFANSDLLVIHVDADIANDNEVAGGKLSVPCPPAKDTCDQLRVHITSLLGNATPKNLVLCVPAQCTEAWVFTALHPDEVAAYHPIECRSDVETLLIGKPERLVRYKGDRARKQKTKYLDAEDRIADAWPNAVRHCPEAERFEIECIAAFRTLGIL